MRMRIEMLKPMGKRKVGDIIEEFKPWALQLILAGYAREASEPEPEVEEEEKPRRRYRRRDLTAEAPVDSE